MGEPTSGLREMNFPMKSNTEVIGSGFIEKLFRQVFKRWPGWARVDHCRRFIKNGRAEDWGNSDLKDNQRGHLPDDEIVQIPVITVVELYTPSKINGLLSGIEKLGWERGKIRSDNLLEWTSEVRLGRSAGSINLGVVRSKDNMQHFAGDRIANLPAGIHAAFPTLITLTPSITALVISFVLDDESAANLNDPLRRVYKTYTKTDPGFHWWSIALYISFGINLRFSRTIHRPMNQQRDAIAECVSTQENLCVRWVQEHLPGTFSSGVRGKPYPTAILFVTDKMEFDNENARCHTAFNGIGFNNFFDAWKSSQWPSVRLFVPRPWDDANMRLIFACQRKNAVPSDSMYHDPESNWTIAYKTHEEISTLVVRWALSCLLDGYHEQLSRMRDESAIDYSHRTVRDLKRLRHLVRTKFYDIVTSAHEADDLAKSNFSYCVDVLDFENAENARRGQKINLLNRFRSTQRERAQQLIREANLLQSLLSVSNEMSQTITNIKIQRLIILLTIISVAIGAVTLWITMRTMHWMV